MREATDYSKYPLTATCKQRSAEKFMHILLTHVPPTRSTVILDPTCGQRNLWSELLAVNLIGERPIDMYGKVIFSDIQDFGHNLVSDVRNLRFTSDLDAIVYDPPFLFGVLPNTNKGKQRKVIDEKVDTDESQRHFYGNYAQTYEDLLQYMTIANTLFPSWLKSGGKLILKCQDQYCVPEKKFYPHHVTWVNRLTNFELIDLFVVPHFRISFASFRIKPPRGVLNHTYFLVFKKAERLNTRSALVS